MQKSENYQGEVIINIRDFFFYLLKKWPVFLILILAGALAGGLYAWIRSGKDLTAARKAQLEQLLQTQNTSESINLEYVLQYKDLQEAYKAAAESGTSEERVAAYNALAKLEKTLNADEIMYYKLNYTDYTIKNPFSKKLPVLGAVGLCFLGLLVLVLNYIFSKSVKSEEEIHAAAGLKIIALLDAEGAKTKNVISQAIKRWEDKGRLPANDRNYLKAALKTMDLSRGVVSGDLKDHASAAVMRYIVEQDARFIESGNLATDAEAQLKAKACEGIVLVIHLKETGKAMLERNMEVAENLDRPVAGAVVIR